LSAAFFIALGNSPVAAQSNPAENDIARALLDEARQASSLGDWERASVCLDEAADKDAGDADILYLRALTLVKRDLPLEDALGNLDGALRTGRFRYYSRRDASTLKAEILVRERRWQDALAALEPPAIDSAVDPAYHLIRARASLGLGDIRAFISELSFSLRRFPDDSASARLFLTSAGSIASSADAREIKEIILGRLPRYSAADPELPVLAAPFMGDIDAKRTAVLAYRAAGGSSAAATIRALEYGLIDEASASSELLAGPPIVALRDLTSLRVLAGSPAGRDVVLKALSGWSGVVKTDLDNDGVAEGSFYLAKGIVTEMQMDSNQDGSISYRASFSDGLPAHIILQRPGLEIDITYSAYPAVSSISFAEKSEKRGYSFGPDVFSYAPIDMRAFAGAGRTALFFPYFVSVLDPSERVCASTALSVAVATGSSRSVTFLEKGIALSAAVYEGGRLRSTTTFERGRPVLERIDIDADGRFETERVYSADFEGAAQPSWLRVDSDGDGVSEYREQLVFPYRKEWDYDGNGSVDALQVQLADGATEQRFSSRLDGRLDETVVVKEGKITSLTRDGVSLPLLPDANPKLTWIGSKRFDLGRNLPAGEGVFSAMGMRYKLTRVGEFAFAELIP
jgi:tetratricopeptide (TPR) repeat protein